MRVLSHNRHAPRQACESSGFFFIGDEALVIAMRKWQADMALMEASL
jgi:hypothetical protein